MKYGFRTKLLIRKKSVKEHETGYYDTPEDRCHEENRGPGRDNCHRSGGRRLGLRRVPFHPCTYTAEPIALALSVVSDTNQTPVVGASVTATNTPSLCHGAPATPREMTTFVTNSSEWHYLSIGGDSGYTFGVSYSGQTYHFSTTLYVEAATCVTLFVPRGGRTPPSQPFSQPVHQNQRHVYNGLYQR